MPPSESTTASQRIVSFVRFSAGFIFLALISIVYLCVAVLLLPSRRLRIYSGNVYGKIVGPTILWISGTRVQIQNKELLNSQTPALYITNHSSELDPFIAMAFCPIGGCGIAKKELTRVPFFGQAYWLSGHLLINRKNREKAIASMAEIANLVRKHRLSIWIWPEGTRSKDGRLLPLKKGFAHTAIATGLPIVPVVAHNAHHRWPARSTIMYPGQLNIDVLPAIDTSEWRTETLDEHIRQVRQIFIDALSPEQRPLNQAAS